MLRSFLVFLMTNPEKGLTEWVNIMKRTPIYALLSGFTLHEIPGVGTFYDFFKRLWPAVDKNIKSKMQKRGKKKVQRGKKKGEKAPTITPDCLRHIVKWLIQHADKKKSLPTDLLFDFFTPKFSANRPD